MLSARNTNEEVLDSGIDPDLRPAEFRTNRRVYELIRKAERRVTEVEPWAHCGRCGEAGDPGQCAINHRFHPFGANQPQDKESENVEEVVLNRHSRWQSAERFDARDTKEGVFPFRHLLDLKWVYWWT